jgi:transmembrane sensor
MEQKKFREILKRYRLGQASPQEEKLIDGWYEAMGKNMDTDERLHEEELEQYFLAKINDHINRDFSQAGSQTGRNVRPMFIWYAVGIAASLLVVIVSFIYLTGTKGKEEFSITKELPANIWETKSNTGNSAQRFTLPDGSHVMLNPKSNIKFLRQFSTSTREVYLEGEGFFEVVHREQQPFLVHAKDVTTKVLGTSFTVRAFQYDHNVTVAVRTGKVSVYTKNKSVSKPEVILTPNQEIIYNEAQESISRRIVDSPQPLVEAEEIKRLRFKEAPASEIFEAIERIYGIDIVFDEAMFSSCTLTTSVTDGGLYKRLDIITNTIGAQYSLVENKIVISGPGCKEQN